MSDQMRISTPSTQTSPTTQIPSALKKLDNHSVSPKLSTQIKALGSKIGARAVVALASPLFFSAALASQVISKIQGKNALAQATDSMKTTEETTKFQTMKQILENEVPNLQTDQDTSMIRMGKTAISGAISPLTNNLKSSLNRESLQENKIKRQLAREIYRETGEICKGPKLDIIYECLKDGVEITDLQTGQSAPVISKEKFNEIKTTVENELTATQSESAKDEAVEELSSILVNMTAVLKNPQTDISKANKEFTGLLRNALNSKAYQALKEDADNPTVKLLHKFASATWNDVKVMDAYQKIGKKVLDTSQLTDKSSSGAEIAQSLTQSHKTISKHMHTDHGIQNKILYAISHVNQTLGSMASEGGFLREIAGVFGKDVYDSHGQLSNNPSLQGTTTINDSIQVNNCYGGSPTIGDSEIAPEFLALCQLAENNQFSEKPDPSIPTMVSYTNLQSLDKKGGEGPRSRTIMALNEKFPLSFQGITLAKDSEFYMMKKHLKGKEDAEWRGATSFGQEMKSQLMKGVGPEALTTKGHGFFFPGPKSKWEPIFSTILEKANAHFKDAEAKNPDEAFELRGAYQEYVYSMIQGYVEMDLGQKMVTQGIEKPTITAIRACKENIDRGGAENVKYMYTRIKSDHPDKLNLIAGAFHSRALSARKRAILKGRTPQIFSFMKHVSAEKFQQDLTDTFGIKSHTYQVAVPQTTKPLPKTPRKSLPATPDDLKKEVLDQVLRSH